MRLSRRILAMLVAIMMMIMSFPTALSEESFELVEEPVAIQEPVVEEPVVEEPVVEEPVVEEPVVEEPVVEEPVVEEPVVEEPIVEEPVVEVPIVEVPVVEEPVVEEPVVEEPVVEEPVVEEPVVEEPVVEEVFSEGYAVISADSAVYNEETLENQLGSFEEDAVVYALSRVEIEEADDVFEVIFAVDDAVVMAYAAESDIAALSEEAIIAYEASAAEAGAVSEKDALLINCAFIAFVVGNEGAVEEPSSEEPTEVENETQVEVPAEEFPADGIVIEESDSEVVEEIQQPDAPFNKEVINSVVYVDAIDIFGTDGTHHSETEEIPENVYAGTTFQLIAKALPSAATNKQLDWKVTEGADVASVSANGLVSFANVTDATPVTVTAFATDHGDASTSSNYYFMVRPKATALVVTNPAGNTFNYWVPQIIQRAEYEDVGYTPESYHYFNVAISPAGTFGFDVTSSNYDIADVVLYPDENMFAVIGHNDGTAIISVNTVDGMKSYSFYVTVQKDITGIEITKDGIATSDVTIARGGVIDLNATLLPVDATGATDSNIGWLLTTGQNNVKLYANGLILGAANGTATLLAYNKLNTSIQASCTIHVVDPVSAINITGADGKNSILYTEGDANEIELSTTVLPSSAIQDYTLSVDDASIATIEGNVLRFSEPGNVTVTATAKDGTGKTGSAVFSAIQNPVSFINVFNDTTGEMVGNHAQPGAITIAPRTVISMKAEVNNDADYPNVSWRFKDNASSDALILTPEGLMLGLKEGVATIEAYAQDGINNVSAFVEVHIAPAAASRVYINTADGKTTYRYNNTEPCQIDLINIVQPANASGDLNYITSDPAIAQVHNNEDRVYVEFYLPGTVSIQATAKDGSGIKSNVITLTVVDVIDSIEITNPISTINVGGLYQLDIVARNAYGAVIENAPLKIISGGTNYLRAFETGLLYGTAVRSGVPVYVFANDGLSSASAIFTVDVTNNSVPVTVHDDCKSLTFENGVNSSVQYIKATLPAGVAFATFTSSNENVIVVQDVHLVGDVIEAAIIATGAGAAEISILPAGAAARYAVKVPVTVVQNTEAFEVSGTIPSVEGVSFDIAYTTVNAYYKYLKSVSLPINRTPVSVTNPEIDLKIEPESIGNALVYQSGEAINVYTAYAGAKPGIVYVTATPKDSSGNLIESLSYTFSFNVTPLTTSVTVTAPDGTNGVIDLNQTNQLQLTATTADPASSQKLLWLSGNEDVVTVDPATGLVTAVAPGSTYVYAYAQDSILSIRGYCQVSVQWGATDIVINPLVDEDGNYIFEDGKIVGEEEITMTIGQLINLTPLLLSNGTDVTSSGSYTFAPSTATNVFVMNAAGLVLARTAGTAEITLMATDGSGKSDTILINVLAPAASVTISTVDDEYVTTDVSGQILNLYDTDTDYVTLLANAIGQNGAAALQDFTWTSSNPAVACFDGDINTGAEVGVVLQDYGFAVITAKATDGSNKSAVMGINYGAGVTNVIITGSPSLTEGKTTQLTANIFPSYATNPVVEWFVPDVYKDYITVKDGLVTALDGAEGQVEVSVNVTTGGITVTDTHTLTIVPKPDTMVIELNGEDITGETITMSTAWTNRALQLKAILSVEDSALSCNQAVTWLSSNSRAVYVDQNGVITALAPTAAPVTIYAIAVDNGDLFERINVSVNAYGMAMGVIDNDYETIVGEDGITTYRLAEGSKGYISISLVNAPAVMPMNVTVTDTDGNNVISNCELSVLELDNLWFDFDAVNAGTAKVTISPSAMPSAALSFNIQVDEPLTGLDFTEDIVTLNINNSAFTSWKLHPEFTPDVSRKLIYSISEGDEDVVSVDENGVLTAIGEGTATVYAVPVDGSDVEASCEVKVIRGPKSIRISADLVYDYLYSGEALNLTAIVDLSNASSEYGSSVTWRIEGISDSSDYLADNSDDVTFHTPQAYVTDGFETFTIVATAEDMLTTAEYEIKVISPSEAGFEYTVDENGRVTISKYNISDGTTSLRIPIKIDGKPVVRIAKDAFVGCEALTEIIWPSGVQFEEGVWDNLPNVKTQAENSKFQIVENVLYKFNGTAADTSVTIPANVTKIGDGAFRNNTVIQFVSMSNDVTEIGVRAFAGCTALKQMTCYD